MTYHVKHTNTLLSQFKQQQIERVRELESQIDSLKEEIRLIELFYNRIDD